MASREARLGDVVEHRKGFAFKSSDYRPTGWPIVRASDFRDWDVSSEGGLFLDAAKAHEYGEYRLRLGDVLIATVGSRPGSGSASVGRVVQCTEDVQGSLLNQNTVRLRSNGSINQSMLFYVLKDQRFNDFILGTTGGSAQSSITLDNIFRYTFELPPRSEQDAIAAFLDAVSARIRSFERTNVALEKIARAIFKSWFVDFDPVRAKAEGREPEGMGDDTAALFPSDFESTPTGPLPRGWTVARLSEACDVVYGAAFASKAFKVDGSGVPLIRIRDLRTMLPGVSTDEVHAKGFLVTPGDVVVGMDGEFRAYYWLGEPAWLNQRVCYFKPKSAGGRVFVKETLRPLLADVERGQVGTTVIHIGKADIDRFCAVLPSAPVLEAFNQVAESLLDRLICNSQSIRNLADLRDTLLPRLISGKLRIPEAEKMVEAVL